jgi:hypothetical protein
VIIMRIFTLLLMCISIGFGSENPDGVPKGAVAISPIEYRFKDTKGKTWIYRQTPFGYSKSEEKAAAVSNGGETPTPFGASVKAAPAEEPRANAPNPFGSYDASRNDSRNGAEAPAKTDTDPAITAKEDGDSIRFEKSSPFGSYKWTRKKNELNTEEQEAWDRQRSNTTTTRTGSK